MSNESFTHEMLQDVRQGDKKNASRLMRLIEDGDPQASLLLSRAYDISARAHRIGVTGWPGVGKSTLVNGLAKAYLKAGRRVGIVAVDPSSPRSGGSLLGDRIRYRDVDGHPGLFIRSMASRGYGGGVGRATRGIIQVLELMGHEIVLLETIGVGQDQVAVGGLVDTTLMVTAPGLGDFLQALKAGVLEIGDILVVNKADQPNTAQAVADLKALVAMGHYPEKWVPKLVATVAIREAGIADLLEAIGDHRRFEQETGLTRARISLAVRQELMDLIGEACLEAAARRLDLEHRMPHLVDRVLQGKQDPFSIVRTLLQECRLFDDASAKD